MQNRTESKNLIAPSSPTLKPQNKDHLNSLIGKRISLKVLQWLYEHMQPHQKAYSIIDIALILQKYLQRQLKSIKDPKEQPSEDLRLTSAMPVLKLEKRMSTHNSNQFELKRDQTLYFLLQQIRVIFLYQGRSGLSYQMINEYIYNQQLRCLQSQNIDEDYMQIGEKRVRIDENLKLCILPLANFDQSNPQNRNRDIIFRENKVGAELQTIYAVTRESIRGLHIRTELIGIASDYDRKGSNNSCWYKYQQQCIKPKRDIILNQFGRNEQKVALTSAQQKQIRASKMTNLQQMIPSHRLHILEAQVCNSSIGIICMDQSFIIQPLGETGTQGYIGNLVRDIPPVVAYKGSKDVYQQVLKLHCFSDNSWLVLTQKFIYKYQIPSPSQNVILSEQNNADKLKTFKPNPLLMLCQRLPSGCIRAEIMGEKHVALMLASNCIVIIELVINNKGILAGTTLSPSDNYYKITNKIYNDIQFKAICYNPVSKYLFLSDFGSFIIRLTFSPTHGDIQEQGPTHDKEQNQELNRQLIKNSYIQLKASRAKLRQNTILEMQEEYVQSQEPFVEVYYIKGAKQRQHQHLLTLYKKQNKSPHTVIIKNQSRQNITLITTNSHYNTLITYQSESVQKSALGEYEREKYKQWGNQNKIKLWDARHMTIYQTLNITIEATCIHLRSNGLYFLTTQKGYLGFYQFNQDKKAMIGKAEQRLLDKQSNEVVDQLGEDIILESGVLFYTTCRSTFNKFNNNRTDRTYLSSCSLEKYPQSLHLQTLPSEINSIAVKERIYILQNSRQGVEASQLHIYNRLGLKEQMLVFSNHEDIDVITGKVCAQNYNQQFKMIKKLNHQQFEVVVWNNDSLKLLGLNRQLSLTVIFHFSKKGKSDQIQKIRQIKNIEINGVKMLVYYEQRTRIPETNISTNSFSISKEMSSNKDKKKRQSRYRQISHHNIAIFNCLTDRLIYQLQKISHNIKILHVYNSTILTRQQDPSNSDYDLIRVIDIAQHGQLLNKYLFSVKVMRQSQKLIKMSELNEYNIGKLDQQKNVILQQIREFIVKRHIQIEESKIAVSESNKLLLILVFRIETQIFPLSGNSALKSDVHFLLYTRNISDELMNRDYKISRVQIGRKMKRNIQEYQTSAGRNEDISDHKQLTFQQLCSMSSYAEINMQLLCEQIQQESGKIPILDLTPRLLSPNLITISRTKDTFQLISLNNDQSFCKLISQSVNKISALSSLTFKIIQYEEEKLAGVAVVSSKSLKSMVLYKIGFDCSKATNDEDEPYRVDIKLQKFAVLQALSPVGKLMGGQTLRIIEWSKYYKTEVDKLWDKTFNSITTFLKSQRQEKREVKSPIKQVSLITNEFKLPTLKIRKAQILKRKLQQSQKSKDNVEKSPRYMKTFAEEADDLSMMFKKWSISQSITRQRQELQSNNKMIEAKMNNKELTRILKNDNDRSQRIQQLIAVSRQIKDISDGALDESKYSSPSPKKKYSYLENVIRSAEVANKNTLKSYLQEKKAASRNTNQTNRFGEAAIITRTETNQSNLLSEITKMESINNEAKILNASKLSMYSNLTKKSTTNGKRTNLQKVNLHSAALQSKLTTRLQQIQMRSSQSEQKQKKKLEQSSILKRTQSTKKNSPKHDLQKKRENLSPDRHKKQSSNLNYLALQTPIRLSCAQSNDLRNTDSSKKRYKTEISVNFNFDLKKVQVRDRLLTENQDKKSQARAIQKMKQSQNLLKSHILPQIFCTKQKLTKKMKEKRSYVKIVHDYMQDSNLQVINNATQRKNLVSKLLQYK